MFSNSPLDTDYSSSPKLSDSVDWQWRWRWGGDGCACMCKWSFIYSSAVCMVWFPMGHIPVSVHSLGLGSSALQDSIEMVEVFSDYHKIIQCLFISLKREVLICSHKDVSFTFAHFAKYFLSIHFKTFGCVSEKQGICWWLIYVLH